MATVTQPSKEQVRQYLAQRRTENSQPPAPAEIRRRLGWALHATCGEKRMTVPAISKSI
jgi:hypothetical protein